jgi:hypothetical protein
MVKCEVHGCSWKGRRNRAEYHRKSCQPVKIEEQELNQEVVPVPRLISTDDDDHHFRQFVIGKAPLNLSAKLKILAFGLLLRVTRNVDCFGNWYCGKMRVKTKLLTLFLMNHYHWVFNFEE